MIISSGSHRKNAVRLAAIMATGILAVCIPASCGNRSDLGERVTVTGASTLYPIIQKAAEHLRSTKTLDVRAQAGGSTRGFEDCIAGRNTMGAMARELTTKEASLVRAFPVALDGVGIVVHESNSLKSLTTEELRKIYLKKTSSWEDLGGGPGPIVVVNKAEGHATLEVFLEHTSIERAALSRNSDVVAGDNAQVIRVVANTKGAIGYVSLGEVMHASDAGMPVRLLVLDDAEPTLENVASRKYPMSRTLYLISQKEPEGGSRILLDFLQSIDGKEIIRSGNYVPL